jgi:ubiquinone/menaquinone biosynthesis C-methylase UbiE
MNNEKWEEFDEIVREVFAPIYHVIARKIVEMTGVREGICIDVGTGTGALAIAIARMTNLKVYALDISKKALEIAKKHVKDERLDDRVIPVLGDVHNMPFKSNLADLIVSRGSVSFWEDKVKAFREIYRVLKSEGVAFVGGGFGTKKLKEKILDEIRKRDPEWNSKRGKTRRIKKDIDIILSHAGIQNYKIVDDDANFWIVIKKKI